MEQLISQSAYGPLDGKNFEFAWDGGHIKAHLLSDVGRKREKNEDSILMTAPESTIDLDEKGLLFAVADGMGGASAGEYASRMALNMLSAAYFSSPPIPIPAAIRNSIEQANGKVYEEASVNPAFEGMGTTVSSVVIHGDHAYIGQVGDSRVYLMRERVGIVQLTRDHSLVAEQVRHGMISEEEARTHSLKNLITRAVGIKGQVKVDLFVLHLHRHDTLVICSDGLSNMVSDEGIASAFSTGNIQDGTRQVVQMALEAGGTDNITCLTLHMADQPPKHSIQEGADEIAIRNGGFFGKLKDLFK